MANVPLYFEIHIRPLFREIDREHMLPFNIDLWDYQSLTNHLSQVKGWITASPSPNDPRAVMPPTDSGGPWPAEFIATFLRWIDEGKKRLSLASATYTVSDFGGGVFGLTADGTLSVKDSSVWLERSPLRGTTPVYFLYEKPPLSGAAGTGNPFSISEAFERGNATSVQVIDKNGTHTLPLA